MIHQGRVSRRRMLRGMLGGTAVTVALPFLDCFLDANGTATAAGKKLPVCFGTWFQALGFNPGFWEPKTTGANYEFGSQLKILDPFRDRINIFSGMRVFLDGSPIEPHFSGAQVGWTGGLRPANDPVASVDSLIADIIGTRTRFRSIEVSYDGTQNTQSCRSVSATNASEVSPVALYTRIFGPDFKDPNAADFKPDPHLMTRISTLSAIKEDHADLVKQLGASDKARVDEYFTSLREIEQQLSLQLQKPEPLEACSVPGKSEQALPGTVIEDAVANAKLFGDLLAHALACGQTQVFNVSSGTQLRRAGSSMTHHMYTHEEPVDDKLGYQPNVAWFQEQVVGAFLNMLKSLDGIREGDRTLLDRTVLLYQTDHSYARGHTLENMPIITAGGAGGRIKTGLHIRAPGDPVTRVGLTLQQALGVPVNSWGMLSNQTSKTITELVA